jgi:hypothetical protein
MNEQELLDGLRAIRAERTTYPDVAEVHRQVLAIPLEQVPQRHGWWPFPRWRHQSVSSTVKYIAAAAIVVLFGGLLLASVLTIQPGDEVTPGAVSETSSPMATEGSRACGEGLGRVTLEVGDLLEKWGLELSAVIFGDSVPDPPPELIELVIGKATMEATGSGCYGPGTLNLAIAIGEPPCRWPWGPVCGEDAGLSSSRVEYHCDTSFEMLPGEDIWIWIEPVPEFADPASQWACPVWSLVHHPS